MNNRLMVSHFVHATFIIRILYIKTFILIIHHYFMNNIGNSICNVFMLGETHFIFTLTTLFYVSYFNCTLLFTLLYCQFIFDYKYNHCNVNVTLTNIWINFNIIICYAKCIIIFITVPKV